MPEDTNPNPGENEDDPVDVADKPREPTPYERQLRQQRRRAEDAAREARAKLAETETRVRAEADARIAAAQSEADKRLIRAELKAHAVKAGIVDLDGLKLTEAGEVEGADALIASLKTAKPWLFGQSSSSAAKPPPVAPSPGKSPRDMTAAEYEAAKRAVLRGS